MDKLAAILDAMRALVAAIPDVASVQVLPPPNGHLAIRFDTEAQTRAAAQALGIKVRIKVTHNEGGGFRWLGGSCSNVMVFGPHDPIEPAKPIDEVAADAALATASSALDEDF